MSIRKSDYLPNNIDELHQKPLLVKFDLFNAPDYMRLIGIILLNRTKIKKLADILQNR